VTGRNQDAHLGTRPDRRSAALRRSEVAGGPGRSDPACGDAYVYALREEAAYLQTDEDQKPEIIAECSFCRKTDRRRLFGAEDPVRDPNTFAVIAQICICSDCVAKFAERLAHESPEAPSDTVVDGTDRPCRARPAAPVPGCGGPERRQVHGPQGRQRPPGASVGPDSPRRQGRHRSGAAAAARLRTRARAAGTQRLPRDGRGRERAARRLHAEGPSAASWTSARCTSRGRRRSCSPTRS
jgi:hypothetical protein